MDVLQGIGLAVAILAATISPVVVWYVYREWPGSYQQWRINRAAKRANAIVNQVRKEMGAVAGQPDWFGQR